MDEVLILSRMAVLYLFSFWCLLGFGGGSPQPHIIIILADDLGWNDVSFHGSKQIPTPSIDELALNGVILFNYYVQPICTPTRSALMTGKYPIHLGLQHATIRSGQPYGLGLEETIMADHLRRLGYRTHAVGKVKILAEPGARQALPSLALFMVSAVQLKKKQEFVIKSNPVYYCQICTDLPCLRLTWDDMWHLGFFRKDYIPINRGFDSFFGYYGGKGDYYNHVDDESYTQKNLSGIDFHANGSIYKSVFGQYSTELFTERAEDIIRNHKQSQPLFLYLAHQAVHSANDDDLLQAPQKYIKRFPNIHFEGRKKFAAMTSCLDDSVKNIVTALKENGLYNNSIILFSSDNGGPSAGFDGNYANNWPLRGTKRQLWEGGVRATGLVHSPLIQKPGRISYEMIHVTDWLPTFYKLGGGDVSDLLDIDGFDVWETLSRDKPSPRKEILLNIDYIYKTAALRSGDYKIILGELFDGAYSGWYPPESLDKSESQVPNTAVVSCPKMPSNASTNCRPTIKPCLYNIRDDPCEFYNIADWNQDIVSMLLKRLDYYNSTAVPIRRKREMDPNADPDLHGGYWVPWM